MVQTIQPLDVIPGLTSSVQFIDETKCPVCQGTVIAEGQYYITRCYGSFAATTSCKIVETLSLKNTFSNFQYSAYLEFKPFPLPLPSPPFNVDCLSSQHFFVLLATLIRGGGGLQCER